MVFIYQVRFDCSTICLNNIKGVYTSGGDSPGKYLVRNIKNISKQIMYKNIVHHY